MSDDKIDTPAVADDFADISIDDLRKKYADVPHPEVRLTKARECKASGNAAFKKKLFDAAALFYQEAIDAIENEWDFTAFDAQHAKELRVVCHSNFAQCMLNVGKHYEARKSCDAALEINDEHAKTLYRRGLAHACLSAFEAARKDFKCALALEPENKNVQKQLNKLQKKVEKHKMKEKKIFKKAFENLDGVFSENRDSDVHWMERWMRWAENHLQMYGPWIATLLPLCVFGGKFTGVAFSGTMASRSVCSLVFLMVGYLQLRWSHKRRGAWLPSWLPYREPVSWVSGSLSVLLSWTIMMAKNSAELTLASKVGIVVVLCGGGIAALGEETTASKRVQDRGLRASSILMLLALLTRHA
jgi:tetratricopeptide (TPR) repeat protein